MQDKSENVLKVVLVNISAYLKLERLLSNSMYMVGSKF